MVKNLPANAGDAKVVGSVLRLGRSPGEGNGNPFWHSCLENSMDRGVWWATVHRLQRVGHELAFLETVFWQNILSEEAELCTLGQASLGSPDFRLLSQCCWEHSFF